MTQIGKYELHEQLGRGGFGTVYRAIDTSLGREVALKVLHPQLTTDPDFLERFRNEARLVAALDSPHIVTVYDLSEADGRVFIAMKYLPGGSLKQKLEQQGTLPFEDTLIIMKQICRGLKVAHNKGLVHRDIKPGNILFDAEGNAVIGDFGLARAVQQSSTTAASSTGGVGTPAYRAPELWIGKPPASPATDIYSLGCVFSEMLTGKTLFEGISTEEILARHLNLGPSLPKTYPVGVPIRIREIVEKAVAKDVIERYQTIIEFESYLGNSLNNGEFEEEQKTNRDQQNTKALSKNKVRWYISGGLILIALALIIYGIFCKFSLPPPLIPTKAPTFTEIVLAIGSKTENTQIIHIEPTSERLTETPIINTVTITPIITPTIYNFTITLVNKSTNGHYYRIVNTNSSWFDIATGYLSPGDTKVFVVKRANYQIKILDSINRSELFRYDIDGLSSNSIYRYSID